MFIECYAPKDPKTGKLYANAVGSSPAECSVYIGEIDLPEDVLLRIEIVACTLDEVAAGGHPSPQPSKDTHNE